MMNIPAIDWSKSKNENIAKQWKDEEEKGLKDDQNGGNRLKPEEFLEMTINRIGYNRHHFLFLTFTCLVMMKNGADVHNTYILAPMFTDKYQSNLVQYALTISAIFMGLTFASFFQGLIKKVKNGKLVFSLLIGFSCLLSYSVLFFDNLYYYIVIRSLSGIVIGFLLNLVFFLEDICPSGFKELIVHCTWSMWSLGASFFYLLCYYLLDPTKPNSWKLIVAITTSPAVIALVLVIIFFRDSPYHLYTVLDYQHATSNIAYLAELSGIKLTMEEREEIKKEGEKFSKSPLQQAGLIQSIREVFANTRLGVYTLLIWLLSGLTLYTAYNSIAMFYSKINLRTTQKNELNKPQILLILIASTAGILSHIVTGLLASFHSIPRKVIIIIGFSGVLIAGVAQIFLLNYYYILTTVVIFFTPFAFDGIKLYCEIFSSYNFSFLFFHALFRLFIFAVPFMVEGFFMLSFTASSIAISVFSLFGLIFAILLPSYDIKEPAKYSSSPAAAATQNQSTEITLVTNDIINQTLKGDKDTSSSEATNTAKKKK